MGKYDEIKTVKYMKWTQRSAICYILFCFISISLFAISDSSHIEFGNRDLFDFAILTLPLWMTNPMVLIISFLGLREYFDERLDETKKDLLEQKWIVFVFWSIVSVLSWMVSGGMFVQITGGV